MRTSGEPGLRIAAARQAVREIDEQQPIYDVKPLASILDEMTSGIRLAATMMAIYSVIAFVLSIAGIYSIGAFAVTLRTEEIGVRVALGAQRSQILRMFLGQGMRLALIGVGIGLPVAGGLTYLLTSLLFGVISVQPLTLAVLTGSMFGVAVLASFIAAHHATRIDPITALRCE